MSSEQSYDPAAGAAPTRAQALEAAATLDYYLGCVPLHDAGLAAAMRVAVDYVRAAHSSEGEPPCE